MKTKRVVYKDYVAGWLDSSIHEFLQEFSPDDSTTPFAYLTCLDSNCDLAALRKKSPELKSLANKGQVVGTGLLLPIELLLDANARKRLLFGFDEIWFFPTDRIVTKPDEVALVGPARVDQARLNRLGEWMSHCDCSLALGDGEGLNFIVKAAGLARSLLAHSLQQPQPTAMPYETEITDR